MSMKKIFFVLCAGALAIAPMSAQNLRGVCGNPSMGEAEKQILLECLANAEAGNVAIERGEVQYVPIHFHLVADANSEGRGREFRVLDQLCALNAAYEPVGFRFYLSPHPQYGMFDKSINSNTVYTTQTSTLLMNLRRHPNALNVYVVDEAVSNSGGPGITLAYMTYQNDWIVSRKDQINGNANNSTIPHEVGHFFYLPHPFNGWESDDGFTPSDPTWPNAPTISPDGVPCERQNGTNCTTAGDYICDTPPDYKFGFNQAGCGNYTGGARDPLGTLADPMENNIMSYFDDCSDYQFTPQQITEMTANLNSNQRNYLDNSFSPVATEITTPTNLLVAPANAANTQFYNAVLAEWLPVDGATHYLLEVDIVPSFATPGIQISVETATSKVITGLQPNKTYYWRVRPFNQYATCTEARSRSFKTSSALSSTVEIEGLSAWQVSPNPVEAGSIAHLTVSADQPFEATVNVVDAAGRIVFTQANVAFGQGQNTLNLPTEGFANGFYLVSLDNGKARDVRKLAVIR
jgi:hypothetical protein